MVPVKWFPSPNYTGGRQGSRVEFIVIHYIVGTLAAADATFTKASSQVSAHYGIGEGELHQYVSELNTAWHAGNFNINTRSIGIEHSADPNRAPDEFTYNTSIELCAQTCRKYGLNPRTAIIPHKQIVATQCPGTVNIQRIIDGTARALGV
ncbi:N-acetylmuramoyl-L-alanine amidase [Acaricomes phytoseiuli]|uniref:N-acetylmuramoyl-L-alanine amidase n=1 Tax=Acaricomes phytoseiuli TaxID=291968 RepID=UPI000365D5AD|nr:peptidoglycan recognition family protein [Acaricomes phytoseiuli]